MPLLCIVDNSPLSRGRLDNEAGSNRGRALSFLTFFARFASIIFIPLADWLVRTLGWRHALVILADILAVGAISLHALILRPRPQDLGLLHEGTLPATIQGQRTLSSTEASRSVSPCAARPSGR